MSIYVSKVVIIVILKQKGIMQRIGSQCNYDSFAKLSWLDVCKRFSFSITVINI